MSNQLPYRRVVMQPTSLCNVNCTYCYLADRKTNKKMALAVAQRVAEDLMGANHPVRLLWHGGEPLASGMEYFSSLLDIFSPLQKKGLVRHSIQTNATLVTRKWCDLFLDHNVHIGVSIDGPEWANINRVDWANKPIYTRIRNRMEMLVGCSVEFSAICVVTEASLSRASELYDFFCEIGCVEVGFNIEEMQGVHREQIPDNDQVTMFWKDLFIAWRRNSKVRIREFDRTLRWIANPTNNFSNSQTDMFPSVAYNGKVVVLSPEFLDATTQKYSDFEAGNVLTESLSKICKRAQDLQYVKDFQAGNIECQASCEYFNFCRGGQASNKFFELGTTAGTETVFCKNSEQRLLDAVLSSI